MPFVVMAELRKLETWDVYSTQRLKGSKTQDEASPRGQWRI
jgi:hypothetical protein